MLCPALKNGVRCAAKSCSLFCTEHSSLGTYLDLDISHLSQRDAKKFADDVHTELANNILSVQSWKYTDAFKSIGKKETQYQYYQRNKAPPETLRMVQLESKPFGTACEQKMCESFGLGCRENNQHDATFGPYTIEIKSARYWAGKDDCQWQHLEPTYEYDFVMFVLLDFFEYKVWMIKKDFLMGPLRENKKVTRQGKQGWWAKKSALLPFMTPIQTRADLIAFVSK